MFCSANRQNCHLSRGVLIFNKTNTSSPRLTIDFTRASYNTAIPQPLAQKLWQWIKFYSEIVRAIYAQLYINFIGIRARLVWIFVDNNSMISLISVRIITLTVRAYVKCRRTFGIHKMGFSPIIFVVRFAMLPETNSNFVNLLLLLSH